MKKCILLFLAVHLLFPYSVLAQEELRISPPSKTPQRNELQLLTESTPAAVSPTISSQVTARVDSLMRYLNASITRLTHIADRISLRREKIGKTGARITALNTKQNVLTQQINRAKQDVKRTEELSVTFLKDSSSLNTYQTFRKQLVSTVGKLTDILKIEKELLANMKQYEVSPSGKLKSL